MLRAICKNVGSVQPHGEPLITYHTFDFESKQLEEWLEGTYMSRTTIGIEVLPIPEPPTRLKHDDDIPF